MKRILILLFFTGAINILSAQETIKLNDLAVPSSPAFILADVTPSLVQTPNTPKAFILGIAQSFQQSSDNFPQDYSAEFTPFWWFKPEQKNVYNFLGLKTTAADGLTQVTKENPFAGIKFTSVSVAFLNKDLIPDTITASQKIFSAGIRTTILKFHKKGYADTLNNKLKFWHDEAQKELEQLQSKQEALARANDSAEANKAKAEIRSIQAQMQQSKQFKSASIANEIRDIINEKPIFSWDVAAAYAIYGINDSIWRTGRSGIWTTLSTYIPLDKKGDKPENYFNLNFSLRYLFDNYQKDDKGIISKNHSVDLGGKLAFELNQFSIGIESLYRYSNGVSNTQNRTVGLLTYKIKDNLYLTGAFGKNFDSPNKLISLFGINWGFGSEAGQLPD